MPQDSAWPANGLDSFLGVDRAKMLLPLIGPEATQLFTGSARAQLEAQAIEKLQANNGAPDAWRLLGALLGDVPQGEEFSARLASIWREIDFAGLFQEDRGVGTRAVLIVSLQLGYLVDEGLRVHIKEQLVEIARVLANDGFEPPASTPDQRTVARADYVALELLEATINSAFAPGRDPGQVMAEFVGMAVRISEVCPALDPIWRPLVEHFSEDLPVAFSGPLSPLLVRLRAS